MTVLRGDCPLVAAGADQPGHCRMCAATLTGRRTRWCSDEHAVWWSNNHDWTSASREAIRRASLQPTASAWDLWTYCDECGKRCGRIDTVGDSRREAEVNHVQPRHGQGYGKGCWNHQTNLQVLCHNCHLAETARQKRARLFFDMLDPERLLPFVASTEWTQREVTEYVQHGTRPAFWDAPKAPDGQQQLGLVA